MKSVWAKQPAGIVAQAPARKLFDGSALRPLRCLLSFLEDAMDSSPGESSEDRTQPGNLPPLPQLWVGYLLGIATIIAELVAASSNPEMAKAAFPIPPLYLFLLLLVGWVYWLVCVYRYHEVMQHVPGWKHPISPARAVGFHFLLGYNLYWFYKWPREIAMFVNWRFGKSVMRPRMVGLMFLVAYVLRILFDPGLGLIFLFLAASYLSGCLRRAFALPSTPTVSTPSSTE
jgi:hypothetical protein